MSSASRPRTERRQDQAIDKCNEGQWRVIRKVLACEFTWDDVPFSTAYFDRQPDGSFIQLQGRWSDWSFPPDSFSDEPGMLDGTPVPAMSVSGMLAMKEQYPHLRNGGPWRQKDIDDIEILRGLVIEQSADLTPGPYAAEDGRKLLSQNESESRQ